MLGAACMPVALLRGFFGASCSVQHCLYTIYFAVSPAEGSFCSAGSKFVILTLAQSLWAQNCCYAAVLLYSVPQQSYMASRLSWQINRVFVSDRMSLWSTLFFWISPKSSDSFTGWFLLPCTMQGATSLSGKQLQNETETKFTHWKSSWRWWGLRMILFSYWWKLGSVCLLRV